MAAALVLGLCSACSKPKQDPAPAPSASASARTAISAEAFVRPEPPKPALPYNVILIMIDSMRADMPWTGYARDIAPWLTQYQKGCMTYTRAYSLSSYTAKSVVPALVGEYPSAMVRDGMFFTRYPDPDNLFISERAQAAGHTTLSGQAHGYFLPALGNNQGFDDYRLIEGGVDIKAVTSVTGERLTKLAKEMLTQPKLAALPDNRRFFAYFHYMDPHHTYEKHPGHPDFGNQPRDRYDNEMHYTDQLVGELIDWTRSQPWAQRTAVIITADHGEGFGEHNHFRHAYELWESLIKVPLIVCVPGAPPKTSDVRRSHIDLAPTIAALMALPETPAFRGKSLLPELYGGPIDSRVIVADLARSDLMDRRRAVIDKTGYKLIGFGDDRSFQLYNLERDPNEEHDVSQTEPEQLQRMKQVYSDTSATIPVVPVVGGARLKGAPPGQRY
jgi:arylsulfatase A-like enzyme